MLQCKVRHFRAMIYCLEGFHTPRGHAFLHLTATCSLPCVASPPSTLSLPQVVPLPSNTQVTSPKSNSTKPRTIPRLIVNHLRPGLPAGQAALSRPFPEGLGAAAGRNAGRRAGSVLLEER